MPADTILYAAQLCTGILYAAVLEYGLQRRYEPRWTWITVVIGTALVGLLVALRLALAPAPDLAGSDLAWWVWWLVAWSFVSSGSPIIVWQVALRHRS
jgi:hypothetical protein